LRAKPFTSHQRSRGAGAAFTSDGTSASTRAVDNRPLIEEALKGPIPSRDEHSLAGGSHGSVGARTVDGLSWTSWLEVVVKGGVGARFRPHDTMCAKKVPHRSRSGRSVADDRSPVWTRGHQDVLVDVAGAPRCGGQGVQDC